MTDRPWGVRLMLAEDHESVRLALGETGKNEAAWLNVDAAGLDELIKNLLQFRGAMHPPVALEPSANTMTTENPRYYINTDTATGGIHLNIRDRSGWNGYLFPPEECESLVEWFSKAGTPTDDPPEAGNGGSNVVLMRPKK